MYRLWDRKTGAEPGAIKRGGRLAFSDDGKRLAITSSNHAELWRLERDSSATSRDQKITLAEPMDMIILPYFQWKLRVFFDTSIFTPGGRKLLISAGPTVIWERPERQKYQLRIPNGESFFAFSPHGRIMAMSGVDGLRLWKLPVPVVFG